jgi:hypothetical protein
MPKEASMEQEKIQAKIWFLFFLLL